MESTGKYSVLVIEDDQDTSDAFCEHLEIYGIKVLGVGKNGNEAVELYQKEKPDVVLMDMMMPHYDGLYGLKKIRELDKDAKVIMVTADFTGETEKELKRHNVSGIVYKPYDIEQVMYTIEKVCSGLELSTL